MNIIAKPEGVLAMQSSASATVAQSERVEALLFELAGHRFGLRLADVVELVRACALQVLPKAPPPVRGVLNLRGEILPVLDLRRRFELAEKSLEPSDYFVLVRAASRRLGLIVDNVLGIETLSALPVSAAPHLPVRLEYIAGVAAVADGVVLIYDLSTFLSQSEADLLDRALRERGAEAVP